MTEIDKTINSAFDLSLLANFVHQVVNPLNGVAGTLDNLVEGTIKEPARRDQRLRAARAQLEQCITLVRNLAFLTGGTGGYTEKNRRKIVLPQIIIEAAMFFQEEGKSKEIDINLIDRKTQNVVAGHPELIRQVLMNIFDNYIKYGKRGVAVEVDQRIQKRTNIAVIQVDGISQFPLDHSDAEKIGTLGFRGENARRIVASGTGLGMYICQKILSDHGGSMRIQAGRDGRVTFIIKIPVE